MKMIINTEKKAGDIYVKDNRKYHSCSDDAERHFSFNVMRVPINIVG